MAKTTCSIAGCTSPGEIIRGWCPKHYQTWRKHGDPLWVREAPEPEPCTVDGCPRMRLPQAGPGYCSRHYRSWQRYGDPLGAIPRDLTPEDRFWPKVDKNGPVPTYAPHLGRCWIWTASVAPNGYGMFWIGDDNRGAHCVSYEFVKGSIPEGLELDHLCRVRACCNPDHLEAVTHQENVRRGLLWLGDYCGKGHEFTEANTYTQSNGSRGCLECLRRLRREGYHRRNAQRMDAADEEQAG